MITESRSADIGFSIQLSSSGHGVTAIMQPIKAKFAYRYPDLIFMHEAASGPNPGRWYWLKDGELVACVRSELPEGNLEKGVRVKNFLDIIGGDPGQAFEHALDISRDHMIYIGNILSMLQALREADPTKMEIVDQGKGDRIVLDQPAIEFGGYIGEESRLNPTVPLFVSFELSSDASSLKVISLVIKESPDKRVDYDILNLEYFQSNVNQEDLEFPNIGNFEVYCTSDYGDIRDKIKSL